MFTIKHVSLTTGGETLYEGYEPTFSTLGSNGVNSRGYSDVGELRYTDDKGEVQTIRGGKVYVMNDHGKTVASYELERPCVGFQNPSLQGNALNGARAAFEAAVAQRAMASPGTAA